MAGSAQPAKPQTTFSQAQQQRKPIELLQTQVSFFVANLHPLLLLSLLLLSFSSLVRDPVGTLLGLAPVVALVQVVYCTVCLPITGQAQPPKAGLKRKGRAGADLRARVVPAILSLLLSTFLSTPSLYLTLILFGAPLTSNIPHTLLLALHLALLVTPQLFYTHGLETETWLRIASLQLPIDEVYGMSLGACVGAWLGAMPIPLDWDREWQAWPVTVLVGVYVGSVVGKVIGGWVLFGTRITIS